MRTDTENAMTIVDDLKESSEVVRHSVNDISESTGQTAENIQTQTIMTQADVLAATNAQVAQAMRQLRENVSSVKNITNMIESLSTANNQIVDNIVQLSATTEEVTAAAQQSTEITERNFTDSVEAQKLLHSVLEISRQMDKYI